MAKKILTLLGIGAGVMLVRKEMRENPDGTLAKTVDKVATNPTVKRTVDSTKRKASDIIRQQGEAITDKIAEAIKERLFGVSNREESAQGKMVKEDPAEEIEIVIDEERQE